MIFVPEINQKGGVGKSTTTANTAAELARAGRRVLIIDLDPQGTLTEATLGGHVVEGTAEILGFGMPSGDVHLAELCNRLVRRSDAFGVDVLGVNYDRLFAHQDVMKSQPTLQLRLFDLCDAIEDRYDVILADCPPNLGPLTTSAIYASTGILIVVETSEEATKGLGILLKAVDGARRMQKTEFPIIGAALTKFRAGEIYSEDVKAALEATNLFPFVQPISNTTKFKDAFSKGKPLHAVASDEVHRRAVREIGMIADRIASLIPNKVGT
jgi:chromosome partitioning protein